MERVIDEKRRDLQNVGIAGIFDAIALQRTEVVGVAELAAQRFENGKVSLLTLGPERSRQMALEVGHDAVVVEQCVVDVEEKDNLPGIAHGQSVHQRRGARPAGRPVNARAARSSSFAHPTCK